MQLEEYLIKNPKKYLIFDFDETLAKIEIDWSNWHAETAAIYRQFETTENGEHLDEHQRYNFYAEKFGEELVNQIKQFNANYEAQMRRGFTPYPELIEFVKNNQHHQQSVYSSNSRQTVIDGLAKLGIADKFTQIVSRDEVSYIKPDPEGFELIYDSAVPKSDYLMIGNSHADQDMASAAGIDFYLVEYFRPI